jgi:hypothetical protein
VLRQVIGWDLQYIEGWWVDRRRVEDPTGLIVERFDPTVRTQVHAAARAAGVDAALRSHDSRYYGQHSMMRLDEPT